MSSQETAPPPGGATRNPDRFEVDLPTRFRADGELSWNEGVLANLSSSGLCLVAPEADLLPGQNIEFMIETIDKFLNSSTRRIRARVIWSAGGRHGVEFVRRVREAVPLNRPR